MLRWILKEWWYVTPDFSDAFKNGGWNFDVWCCSVGFWSFNKYARCCRVGFWSFNNFQFKIFIDSNFECR